MGLQNQNKNLVLSTDAKLRLKWTPELHQRFVEAVNQLGGPDKATPKSLMRVMGIPGLTLYHLKSHLQKYRLGKSQQVEAACIDIKKVADHKVTQSSTNDISDGTLNQLNESLQIAQALQVQMEVQRKLHDQIEVQRHLQLRIEVQGKYLQSVLKKAKETLAGYSFSSVGVELAKAELSQLASIINTGCPSSSLSELTEAGTRNLKDVERKQIRSTICSMESSLTSFESSGRKEEKQPVNEIGHTDTHTSNKTSVELSLMDIHPQDKPCKGSSSNQSSGRKRSDSTISDGFCDDQDQPPAKRFAVQKDKSGDQLRNSGIVDRFDLNSQYQSQSESGS